MGSEQTNECSRIIVLKGGQDTGKTTVLRALISKLLDFETTFKEKPADVRIYCEPRDEEGFILVATSGDSMGEMKENVKFMSDVGIWKAAVIASRDKERILGIVRKYATDNIKYEEITRAVDESDSTLVDRIYEMIYPSNS